MVKAKYKGCDVIETYGLTQYDYGQRLEIEGISIDDGTEIHFCQRTKAITQYIHGNLVLIPDYMLQYADTINAYVYKVDSKSGETLQRIILYISPREKPGDYVTPEEPAYSRLLPEGGAPGQVLSKKSDGYTWVDPAHADEATELEIIEMMEKLFGGAL